MTTSKTLTTYFIAICIIVMFPGFAPAETGPSTSLFNGKNLNGWNGAKDAWEVKQGIITGYGPEKSPHNILLTDRKFKDFELTVKFITTGEMNTGVLFHASRIEDTVIAQGFEADISPRFYGNLWDEGRREYQLVNSGYQLRSEAMDKTDAEGWHQLKILAKGNHFQVWYDGVQTIDYTEQDATIPLSGSIGIPCGSRGEGICQFKDLKIVDLSAPPTAPAKTPCCCPKRKRVRLFRLFR